ncbi:MAG: bifunctional DNA-formamidopyrimidine glycosylase/DNA-(apurinic or apyrimidinic site) lyase [Candidatus Andersenbacteria bacterium]
MPELPEVETVRLGLMRRIIGKEITRVQVKKAKLIRGVSAPVFVRTLKGSRFGHIDRIGKLLILSLMGKDRYVLVHLKMTGQLIYQKNSTVIAGGHQWPPISGGLPNAYSHIIIDFADGGRLFFNDLRQFGYMELASAKRRQEVLDTYGVDPLLGKFTYTAFRDALAKRSRTLKAVLLDQSVIAGIGNIYADEICFHARIRPNRSVKSLSEKELKALFVATKHIMKRALEHGGTTFKDYRDSDGAKGNFTALLKVYGRGGAPCKRCRQQLIKKIQHAGRGTHFCLRCQV